MSLPRISVRGIRQTLSSGKLIGRTDRGRGPAQVLDIKDIGDQLVSQGVVASGGGTGNTYTAGTGLTLTSHTFSLTNPVTVALGGTGLATGTSGGIPAYTGSTTITSSGVLAANALVLGGGAAAVPTTDSDWKIASHVLTGSLNAAALPSAPANTILRIANADGTATRATLDNFSNAGAASNNLLYRQARGTASSPSALQSTDIIGRVSFFGYGATGYSSGSAASYVGLATENWTDTTQGCGISYFGTPIGTATPITIANLTAEGGSFIGTNTNDSAAAGFVGEYASTIILIANEVSINTAANIATLSLTAGDWDVWGEAWLDTNTGTATVSGECRFSVTPTTGTIATVPADGTARASFDVALIGTVTSYGIPIGPVRASLSGTTNYYLVGKATVSAGTAYGYGKICARRVR